MDQSVQDLMGIIDQIISGVPLEWGAIPDENKRDALIIAIHCCVNGPVGVNKATTFPVVGPKKIKDFLGASNSSWKGFCRQVATILAAVNPNIDCNQIRQNQKYWPL